MKDIITTGLGMVLFGDVQFSIKNLLGIGIGLLGGILYSLFGSAKAKTATGQSMSKLLLCAA